jgi:hypothetical protein
MTSKNVLTYLEKRLKPLAKSFEIKHLIKVHTPHPRGH